MTGAGEHSGSGARFRRQRNEATQWPAPTAPMSSNQFPHRLIAPLEPDLEPFAAWFYSQPNVRDRFRWVLRDSLDELFDGQRTGRWAYQHLSKTEKTHLGTIVEVNLTKDFRIPDGQILDWTVAGEDLDCKFSKDYGGWEIPMEMYLCADHGDQSGVADHAALLLWMNDDLSQWAAGLLRASDSRLRWRRDKATGEPVRAYNRDNKRRLAPGGIDAVHWLWGGRQDDLPENALLHMNERTRKRIFSKSSGQQRINELFRLCQGRLVTRATILTVGQQADPLKRARDARLPQHLGREGILVLGHQEASPIIARILGLPVPTKGEFLACRITTTDTNSPRPKFHADGNLWAVAYPDESTSPAPSFPDKQPPEGWESYLNRRP